MNGRGCLSGRKGLAQLPALLLAFMGLVLATAAGAQETANWAGSWDTKWRGGGAQLELQQTGSEVTGRYPIYKGRIEAKAKGSQLTGRWIEGDRQGNFLFVQSPDGTSFMGRYEGATGEWWTGIRADAAEYKDVQIDQSSPMMVMASFIKAMNESGADNVERAAGGSMALAGKAADVLDVSEADRGGLSEVDYARQLFAVIDRLTFRLWSLPHDTIAGDTVTARLGQFDTTVTFDATFRRKNGQWFLVGPPLASLQAKRNELAAARGEPADAVSAPRNLRTPRDAFKMLLSGLVGRAEDPAPTTLDMRNYSAAVRADEAALLARYLKKVIDRVGYVTWQEIPDDPKAKSPFVFLEHPSGDVVVGPVETDKGVIWQFTPQTLNTIRGLYADMEDMPVAQEFAAFGSADPYFFTRGLARDISPSLLTRAGPIERWQWLLLGVAVLAGLALGTVASAVLFALARWQGGGQLEWLGGYQRVLPWSVRAIVLGLFLLFSLRILGLPEVIATPVKALAWSAIVIGAVPATWYLIGRAAESYRRRWKGPGYHETLISLMTGFARVAVLVIAFLLLAEVLAIPYQGVLAGLGIGGLAVALAAQPTLQNFLSGLTLYADRPVSVGDFCQFGSKQGTIEHIGMRSTRIRSPDRTVISVPNSEFANMQLENYARRDRIRLNTTLQVRYETTADQLRYVLAELNKLLVAHPSVADDPCRVRFVAFGAFSLDIEVYAYILTASSPEFLAIREDIFLRMIAVLDEAGVQLAFPAQVEYTAQDLPLDAAKRMAAEEKVRAWREANTLPFPDLAQAERAEIVNTLAYPPEGSARAREIEPVLPFGPPPMAAGRRGWGLPWRKSST